MAAADPRRRRAVVPAVQRAGRRQRPRARCTTRARRVDGGWRLTGQKVWTSYAQFADWGLCLARTDPDAPKRKGISFFVVDMRARRRGGATAACSSPARPSSTRCSSTTSSCPTTSVGRRGERRAGASRTRRVAHERGINPRQLVIHTQLLDELLRLALEQRRRSTTPRLRSGWPRRYVEVRLFQLHNWRSLSRLARRRASPGPRAARSSCTGAR